MIAYASRTGTKSTLAALRGAGWRLLVTPQMPRTERSPYALDNGAWSAFQRQTEWDEPAFVAMLFALGRHADWVVAPDIVAGGMPSLARSLAWLPRCMWQCQRTLIAVQDGMEVDAVASAVPFGPRVGIFVGGSTEWKLATMRAWGVLARAKGAHLHIGRVNTARRIRLCQDAGADSFDGTSVSQFPCTLSMLDNVRRQLNMYGGLP